MTPGFRISTPRQILLLLTALLTGCGDNQAGQDRSGEAAVPVIAATAIDGSFTDAIEALGTTRSNESVQLTANIAEKITQIAFEDGARVRKGNVIARLDDASERAALKAAQARLAEKQKSLERSKTLLEENLVSQSEYDLAVAEAATAAAEVGTLQAAIGDRVIRAPFSGRVGLRQVSVGSLIQPGSVITTLDDLSVMKVDFTVPAVYLSVLEPGLPIHARTASFPDRVFKGELASVDTQVDPVSRSIAARAYIPNSEEALRPGMLVELELQARERSGISVPEAALVPRGNDQFVFVLEDGQARQRQVAIGTRRNGSVEIAHGLAAGEQVIVHGTLKLADGRPVNVLGELDGTRSIEEILRSGAGPKPD